MPRGARDAAIRIGIDQGALDRSLGASKSKLGRWAKGTGREISRSMHGALDSLTNLGGLGAAFGLATAAKDVLEFETRITRLQISSRGTTDQIQKLKAEIFAVGKARGVDPEKLLGGVETFVALTGKVDVAAAAMDTLGEAAAASGSDVNELAVTAAALTTNFGLSGDQMKYAFGVLLAQGKSGAIEMKDLATIVAGLTPQFATFGAQGTDALDQMGASLQIMRSGFGSASETATGLSSLMTAMVKNSKQLEHLGVKVFDIGPDGAKHMRDFAEIAFDLIDKSKGDPRVLQKVLGRTEAYQALLPMMRGGREEFERLVKAGKGGAAELDRDFATIAATPAAKIARAKAQIKEVLDAQLARFLPDIADAIGAIAKAIGFIADHSTEAIAVFAAMKLGGALGGLGATVAGGAGGGGVLGAAGAAAGAGKRGQGMNGLQVAGNVLQGGAIGYTIAQTLAADYSPVSKGFITVANAAAMLPGPFGLLGKATAGLTDGILLVASYANEQIDKKLAAIAAGDLGQFALDRSKSLGTGMSLVTDPTSISYGQTTGYDPQQQLRMQRQLGIPIGDQQREDAQFFLRRAQNQGLLSQTGQGASASFSMDTGKLDNYLASDKSLSKAQRAQLRNSFLYSQALLGADPQTQQSFTGYVAGPGPAVFGQGGLSPVPGVEAYDPSNDFLAPSVPAAPLGDDHRTPHEAPIRVEISAAPEFNVKVDNAPSIRSRSQ